MQKLRPYVLPGLFVFHLVLLCVWIFTGPTDESPWDVYELEELWVFSSLAILVSQLFLTALWAGLGSEPWTLRIPGCGVLAALIWVGGRIRLERMKEQLNESPDELIEFLVVPLVAWSVLVGLLHCLRVIPFLKWQIVLRASPSAAADSPPLTYSLTHSVLIVVATWGGVFLLLKDIHHWSTTFELGNTELAAEILFLCGVGAITGAVLLLVTMICVGLTLTRLADWMFYRHRWTLPLLVAVVLGVGISSLLKWGPPLDGPTEVLSAICLLAVVLVTQPTAALLVMGVSGYQLAPRSKPLEATSSDLSDQGTRVAEASPAGVLPLGLRGAHVAALAALLVLFCALVSTGVLTYHKIMMISYDAGRNDAGEIALLQLSEFVTDAGLVHLKGLTELQVLDLRFCSLITDAGLVHLKGLTELQTLGLIDTQITGAGLVHLAGPNLQALVIPEQAATDLGRKHYLAALERQTDLDLSGWQITDAGLVHLAGLNLQALAIPEQAETDLGLKHYLAALERQTDLDLSGWQITGAGLVHLKGLTNLQKLDLDFTQITDAGLVHLKGLTELQVLDLRFCSLITDAGLVHLAGLNLQALAIPEQAETDLGLKHYLAALERQTDLDLSGWQITGAGLVHLKGLTNLQKLDLHSTLTDAGLVHLKGLTNLETLDLDGTQITDAGLVHLKGLTELQTLGLIDTQITDAGLVHLKGLTNLQKLDLDFTQITGAGLVHLKGLTNLQKLHLHSTLTDAGLVHLKGLTNLETLGLDGTQITDAGLVHLKGLTNLQKLDLDFTQITDAGLVHLKGLTELQTLGLDDTQITDAGLVHLKGLTNLETLDLIDTQITDAGLVHLKGLTNLEWLGLDGTQITDAGLVHLKGLTELQTLGLIDTQITDAGLVHLKGLTNLETLDLIDTQITDAGITELKKALPNCGIAR